MEPINPTERAVRDAVRSITRSELSKRIPDIDFIDYRRLAFYLIEDRKADYEQAGIDMTIPKLLAEFGIKSPHTYYDWYEKWHLSYARDRNS